MPGPAIHDLAARGFDVAGDDYERGRPEYPRAAVRLLCEELGIGEGKTVIDLGAGTGKLTRQLLPTGARVLAVEPVAGMRARIVGTSTPEGVLEVLEGSAEAMPLPSGSADVVVVAQAFHWFDGDRALLEIHRVLVERGGLGLLWNVRDERVPWVAELTRIIDERGGDTVPRHRTGAWRRAFERTMLFEPLRERTIEHTHEVDRDALEARVASISFVAAMGPAERNRLLAEVRALVDRDPATRHSERFSFPYLTHVYWTRARAQPSREHRASAPPR